MNYFYFLLCTNQYHWPLVTVAYPFSNAFIQYLAVLLCLVIYGVFSEARLFSACHGHTAGTVTGMISVTTFYICSVTVPKDDVKIGTTPLLSEHFCKIAQRVFPSTCSVNCFLLRR